MPRSARLRLRYVMLLAIAALVVITAVPQAGGQQPATVARIGVLLSGPQPGAGMKAFRDGLAELGWVDGRNLSIEVRFTEGSAENLTALAAELVRARVQVILAAPTSGVRAAKAATATIPIVGIGSMELLVNNPAKPERNLTGLVTIPEESRGKHVALLKEAAPKISRLAYFVEAAPGSPELAASTSALGRSLRLTVHPFGVRTADEFQAAFREALERRVDAVAVLDTPFLSAHRRRIVDFVAKHKLPAASVFSGYPESGFLMSYGTSIPQVWRRAAHYVDRLLKGAKPADLPVERPTKYEYELVVNLRTAKSLGLTIPPPVMLRADRLIE